MDGARIEVYSVKTGVSLFLQSCRVLFDVDQSYLPSFDFPVPQFLCRVILFTCIARTVRARTTDYLHHRCAASCFGKTIYMSCEMALRTLCVTAFALS